MNVSRGGGGGGGAWAEGPDPPPPPPPHEKSQNIGFLCNTGPGSLKNHKVTKPAFLWRFAGGPMIARLS